MEVIMQEMSNEEFVIRQHIEDLTTKSRLIVYESQEALFYKSGQALDCFPSGGHMLDTEHLPVLKKIFGAIFNNRTPFPCDIFFINKVNILDFIWGTPSPFSVKDPLYSTPKRPISVDLRANGQAAVRITDSRRFVVGVAGMLPEYTVAELRKTVKGLMVPVIKTCIASTVRDQEISVNEINTKLLEMGEVIQVELNKQLAEYGIEIKNFSINDISPTDESKKKLEDLESGNVDAYKTTAKGEAAIDLDSYKLRTVGYESADLEAYKMQTLANARAKARQMEGYTYQDEQRFDVLRAAATNEGVGGGMVNLGVGLGMGANVAREMGSMMSGAMQQQPPSAAPANNTGEACSECGTPMVVGAKFCPNCGAQKRSVNRCVECNSEIPVDAKFCPYCGHKPGPKVCTECGMQLAPGAKFCASCGAQVSFGSK